MVGRLVIGDPGGDNFAFGETERTQRVTLQFSLRDPPPPFTAPEATVATSPSSLHRNPARGSCLSTCPKAAMASRRSEMAASTARGEAVL
jgi:hypothetical protein